MIQERRLVMVIEDDEPVRRLIAEVLEYAGYDVVECEGGPTALAHLESTCPSLITIDLVMPSMDGFQLLQLLESRLDTAGIPIVVITAAPEHICRRLLAEGRTVVAKPFLMDHLLGAVESSFELRRTAV